MPCARVELRCANRSEANQHAATILRSCRCRLGTDTTAQITPTPSARSRRLPIGRLTLRGVITADEFRRQHGRGNRSDYALSPAPVGSGGQAEVFRAVHKPSGLVMAFKRLKPPIGPDDVARMRREIELGNSIRSPHVMPVIDAASDSSWLVMPFAKECLAARRDLVEPEPELKALVDQVCIGLKAAHEDGYVHRDLKPSNILRYHKRWVVSDWGLVRRPAGATTDPNRTAVGRSLGTEGFAPPELANNPHDAGSSADIYSLGQLIGWAITGEWPRANVPLLPSNGAWRVVVRAATQFEPGRRPQTVDEFVEILDRELSDPPASTVSKGRALLERMQTKGADSAGALLKLAADSPGEHSLLIDILPKMSEADVAAAVHARPRDAELVVTALLDHIEGDWGPRSFDWANSVIRWALRVARAAVVLRDVALLEAAVDALFGWDAVWDRWPVQNEMRSWMRTLTVEDARIVASSLRNHRDAARHFASLADEPLVDARIQAAVAE
jgi:Protein kinase domain